MRAVYYFHEQFAFAPKCVCRTNRAPDFRVHRYPALTHWANLWRTYRRSEADMSKDLSKR